MGQENSQKTSAYISSQHQNLKMTRRKRRKRTRKKKKNFVKKEEIVFFKLCWDIRKLPSVNH